MYVFVSARRLRAGLKVVEQLREAVDAHEARVLKVFGLLQSPRHVERYVYGVRPCRQRGGDVALQRVAHHQHSGRRYPQAAAQAEKGPLGLVGHYLYVVEVLVEARTAQLVLLVEQLAFPNALSRIACTHYDSLEEVAEWLAEHDDELQCVVTECLPHSRRAAFGQAQSPSLTDYPDDRDVIAWLATLPG